MHGSLIRVDTPPQLCNTRCGPSGEAELVSNWRDDHDDHHAAELIETIESNKLGENVRNNMVPRGGDDVDSKS